MQTFNKQNLRELNFEEIEAVAAGWCECVCYNPDFGDVQCVASDSEAECYSYCKSNGMRYRGCF